MAKSRQARQKTDPSPDPETPPLGPRTLDPDDWPMETFLVIQAEPGGRGILVSAPDVYEIVDRGDVGAAIDKARAAFQMNLMRKIFPS